jgi:hypothetical protein
MLRKALPGLVLAALAVPAAAQTVHFRMPATRE